jgi:hypothetical protein
MWVGIAIIVLAVLGLLVWATTRKSRLGHWARFAVMCLSGGFIFPNVTTEDEDITKHEVDKGAKVTKQ